MDVSKFYNVDFVDKMLPKLERAIKFSSNNIKILEQLGSMYRVNGSLEKAQKVFNRLKTLTGRQKYEQLASIFNQEPIAQDIIPMEGKNYAAPFFVKRNFFPKEVRNYIYNYALEHQSDFFVAPVYGVGFSEIDMEKRDQIIYFPDGNFKQIFLDAISPLFTTIRKQLNVSKSEVSKFDMQMSSTGNHQYGKAHSDMPIKDNMDYLSKISFVYYFHKTPKVFTGGDLLVYDTQVGSHQFVEQYTRFTTEDNLIVGFPSSFMHEITKVNSPSTKFEDSRFAVAFPVRFS